MRLTGTFTKRQGEKVRTIKVHNKTVEEYSLVEGKWQLEVSAHLGSNMEAIQEAVSGIKEKLSDGWVEFKY